MKKTLLVTLDFPPQVGGVANYLENVCKNLPSQDLVVLAPLAERAREFDKTQAYKIYRRNLLTQNPFIWPKWLFLFRHISQIVRKEKIEIIQVGQVLPIGTVAFVFKNFLKIPYQVYAHAMDITLPQAYFRKRKLVKSICLGAQKIITVSEFTKKELVKLGVKEKNIVKVYPGTDILEKVEKDEEKLKIKNEALRQRYHLADQKVLLTVGRLVERKGHDIVIKSLPKVLEKVPNLVYLIVSSGPYKEELEKIVKEYHLEKHVFFAGYIPDEDLPIYYQNADIFIMVSRELWDRDVEGFGIVYLEAGALGKPVIGGKSGGVGDAVIDGETGLLVDPEDTEEVAAAIIKLLTDEKLAKKLGTKGQRRTGRDFNWPKQVRKIEEVLV